jgi:hypothetical protein
MYESQALENKDFEKHERSARRACVDTFRFVVAIFPRDDFKAAR